MKRHTLLVILSFFVLAIFVVGSTYAFFSAMTSTEDEEVTSHKFEVIYSGGTKIDDKLNLSSDKTGGLSTSVKIRMNENSALPKASLYLSTETISSNLAIEALKWEVVGVNVNTGSIVYENNGNFLGVNTTTNKDIQIVNNYKLTYTDTEFTVYIWLDGSMVGNEVLGGSYAGNINMTTENFAGEI